MSDVGTMYTAIPPITRVTVTAIFACSVAFYTGMISSEPFWFHYSHLFQFPPAVYRPVTSFLITRQDFAIIFDTFTIYQHLRRLEEFKFTRKEDLLWYLIFVSSVIVILNQVFTGMVSTYSVALRLAVLYTACQDSRGQEARFMVVSIPAQLQFCAVMLLDVLVYGWGSLYLGLTGVVAAHLFDFLTRIYPEFGGGPNLIPTPAWLSWIISTPRLQNTSYGSRFTPASSGSASGSSSGGPLPDSWRSRGSGRRLG